MKKIIFAIALIIGMVACTASPKATVDSTNSDSDTVQVSDTVETDSIQ